VGVECFGEVDEEGLVLEAAGGVCGEQPLDSAFAALGLTAEGELAVNNRAAERALGVVVRRLHAGVLGEVHKAGHALMRLRAIPRQYLLRALFEA
jgi:hypothetical protein